MNLSASRHRLDADAKKRLWSKRSCSSSRDWHRLAMSEGTKGPRLFDWACVPMLHRWEEDGRHWLLIRRSLSDPLQKAYYFVFGPQGTTLPEMVAAIGARWHIEEDFETAKEMGLDQYEVVRRESRASNCSLGHSRHRRNLLFHQQYP